MKGPIADYTRNASNTITVPIQTNLVNFTLVADVFCNLTSPGGFFCREPIEVSVIVIHDLSPDWNLTNLVFLGSRDVNKEFFEIKTNSSVYAPQATKIQLEYSHDFFQGNNQKYVYEGAGTIFYDFEGEFSTTLDFINVEQKRYDQSDHPFTVPTVVVRPQAEFQQIIDSKTNLGLAWIVVGLTIWTIIVTIGSYSKNLKTTSNQSDAESKTISISPESNNKDSKPDRDLLIIEYNQLHNEIQQRNQYGWFIISIFVTASFLISFGGDSLNLSLVKYGVSFGLIGFSWFLHIYFDYVNASCWNRRKEIQDNLTMKGPEKRHDALKKSWIYQIGAHYLWKVLWISLLIIYGALFIIQLG